jgi:hypothetical protein
MAKELNPKTENSGTAFLSISNNNSIFFSNIGFDGKIQETIGFAMTSKIE